MNRAIRFGSLKEMASPSQSLLEAMQDGDGKQLQRGGIGQATKVQQPASRGSVSVTECHSDSYSQIPQNVP